MRPAIERHTAPQPRRTAGLAAAALGVVSRVVAVLGDIIVEQVIDVQERAARAADVVVVREGHAKRAAVGAGGDAGDWSAEISVIGGRGFQRGGDVQ